jgi:hypothetical protein
MDDIELTYREVETLSKEESLTEKYADLCEEDRAFELSPEHQAFMSYDYFAGLDEYAVRAIQIVELDPYLRLRLKEVDNDRWKYVFHEFGERIMIQAKEKAEWIRGIFVEQYTKDGRLSSNDPVQIMEAEKDIEHWVNTLVYRYVVYKDANILETIEQMENEYAAMAEFVKDNLKNR